MICPTCCHDNVPGVEVCANCQQDLTQFDAPSPSCRLERSLMQDQAGGLCTRAPKTIAASATVREAIAYMLDTNVGALLVIDEQGNLQGILSERDLLKKVAGLQENYGHRSVTEFMTPSPETVADTTALCYVLNKMRGGDYRHVPVVHDDKPVGMISVRDMLRHLTKMCEQG